MAFKMPVANKRQKTTAKNINSTKARQVRD